MRPIVIVLALCALIASAGCARGPYPEPTQRPGEPGAAANEPRGIWANSVFGGVSVSATTDVCAGRVQLAQGAATANDTCFTGDTNVVLCTDTSSANAVQCAAANGKLVLAGTGSDLINYARVR
ncbi:MAG: hypothetical protein WCA22_17545 [Candidatus Binatus sp.]